ncbi:DnaJ-domain-containing protein [Byssothecium circinans]|uniref:DnaJ-domain-containing protein n=1 Tax=Byssothecium circinans TaxID=147558 RepID=A0A6A5T6D3_9PLEO|nr:DnaJ-domain-containing protein [Byssothecium circinans]
MVSFNCTFPIREVSPATALPDQHIPPSSSYRSKLSKPTVAPKFSKPRSRKSAPTITIFVDPNTAAGPSTATATPRQDGRSPLGVMKDNGNSRSSSAPVDPTTPFLFSPQDPNWENSENYTPSPSTSPSTPSFTSQSPPTTPGFEVPRVRNRTRARARARRMRAAPINTDRPNNMVLYVLLGITDWKASTQEINVAYRKVAFIHHPDKVHEQERDAAHKHMAKINAAKEVLSDEEARKKYDQDGKLPWTT